MKKYILVLCVLWYGCYDCEKEYIKDKDKYLISTIDTMYRDPKNRGIRTIGLNIISSNMFIYKGLSGDELNGVYQYGEKGDTIIKEVNSLQFKLIKKDTVMYFYPICGCCDTIK